MGPMMALCLKNEKDNEDITQIAHREKDYKLKNLLETCNHTYRFHGKNIIQLAMAPLNHFRLHLAHFKPYLTMQNSRIQSATGKQRTQLIGIGFGIREEQIFHPNEKIANKRGMFFDEGEGEGKFIKIYEE